MMSDPKEQPPEDTVTAEGAEPFDAVAAAAELEESLRAADAAMGGGQSDAYIATLENEISTVNTLLDEKEREVALARTQAAEARAEISDARERLRKDAKQQLEQRMRGVLRGFVDVIDDIDRAVEAARVRDPTEELIGGVELIRRRLMKVLESQGVEVMDAAGTRFDPALHEAISMQAVEDEALDGQVTTVVRQGYLIDGDVLRAATVIVGKRG